MVGHGTSRPAALNEDLESLVRRGHIREAIRRAREELATANRVADMDAQGRCHGALNLAYQYLGQHRESLLSAERAIECYEMAGNMLGLGVVLTRAAVDLAQLGDAEEAMKVMTRALEISRRIDDPALSFRLWNNLAHAERSLGHFQEALSAISHAMEVAERMGDIQAYGHARANSVAYHLDFAGMLLDALETERGETELCAGLLGFDEMLVQCEQHNWPHLVPDMAKAAGKALHAAGRPEEAVRILTHGIDIARRLERRGDLVHLTLDLVSLERQRGELGAAAASLAVVAPMLDHVDSDQARISFHLESSQVSQLQGDFARALAHHQTFHNLTMARMQRLTDARAQVMAIRLGNEKALADAELMRRRAQRLEGDIAMLTGEKVRLATMARQDALTGVGNRRAFDEAFRSLRREELDRAAVLLLDLDYFKAINDTFGHGMGDEVLTRLGMVLTQACRPQDIVCRFGGEEFIVLARNVDSTEAEVIAERLRCSVAQFDWRSLHPNLAVTASIGVAMCSGISRDQAIQDADRALYTAKDLGRNRVSMSRLHLDATVTQLPREFAARAQLHLT